MPAERESRSSRTIIQEERGLLQDHCGIVACYSPVDIPFFMTGLAGLYQLQTRGYDGAGVYALTNGGKVHEFKGEGRINEVFTHQIVDDFKDIEASTWLFQTRYGTDGATSIHNIQPISKQLRSTGENFALVHNGQFSDEEGLSGGSASDTIIFADQIAATSQPTWDERVVAMQYKKRGAWSAIVATSEGLYLTRDSYGIRPLAYGHMMDDSGQRVWMAASETSALKAMGISEFSEVLAGSVIKISKNGVEQLLAPEGKLGTQAECIFENIYLAEGNSALHTPRGVDDEINDSFSIDTFRKKSGQILAREAPLYPSQVDFAIGIPGTGIAGGRSFAHTSGIPYIQAISDRNPQDDARTFMTPDISDIFRRVLEHFYFNESVLEGMRVVLIDDSIVRGNITKGLVQLLKNKYGVKEVHLRILSPPIDKSCYLGINTRKDDELIAARHQGNIDAIREEIGADSLAYLSDGGLYEAVGREDGFCLGCMVNHRPPIDRKGNVIFADQIETRGAIQL